MARSNEQLSANPNQKQPIDTDKKIRYGWRDGFRGFTVSNAPAVGGSSLVTGANVYFEDNEYFDVGDSLKRLKEKEPGDDTSAEKTDEEDNALDEKPKKIFASGRSFGINGKLAAVNAFGDEGIVRIIATCDRKIAAKRAVGRRLKQIKQELRDLDAQLDRGLIPDEVHTARMFALRQIQRETTVPAKIREIQERVRKDREQWARTKPETAGVDIYDKDAEITIDGKKGKLYDLQVTTTHHGGISKNVASMLMQLEDMRAIERIPFPGQTKKTEVLAFEEPADKLDKPNQQKSQTFGNQPQ